MASRNSVTFLVLAVSGSLWFHQPASAAIISNLNSGATAGQGAFDAQISATDLVNNGQATLAGVTAPTSSLNGTFAAAGLNDGSATGNTNKTYYQSTALPATITFSLNLTSGTGGSTTGYDITSIKSFAGWTDSNIGAQSFQLLLKTIAVPSFTSYGTFANTAGFDGTTTGAALSTLTTLTDSTGTLASGVTAVQFVYSDPPVPHGSSAGGTVVREIDVFGTPSPTPEPASIALLGLSSLLLLARKRAS